MSVYDAMSFLKYAGVLLRVMGGEVLFPSFFEANPLDSFGNFICAVQPKAKALNNQPQLTNGDRKSSRDSEQSGG